ncbi:unnamed protein product [Lasius platythorax]|uniref:Myb/SANT-like DNA-binding domain-containing protein n=1 Tax=Lasius platythorax TaxID=488582 RepID=A0AAV2NL77_9HYME
MSESEENKENNTNKTFEGESSEAVIWSKSATLLFLTLYQEYAPEIENGKCNQKTVFQKISQKLTENEFVVSPKQCMTKLTTMKRMYKKIKDHNSKSGNDRQTWSYYEQMEEIFGKKPWVKPLCTLSSSSENNVDNEKATIVDIVDEPSAKKAKLSNVVEKHLEKLI